MQTEDHQASCEALPESFAAVTAPDVHCPRVFLQLLRQTTRVVPAKSANISGSGCRGSATQSQLTAKEGQQNTFCHLTPLREEPPMGAKDHPTTVGHPTMMGGAGSAQTQALMAGEGGLGSVSRMFCVLLCVLLAV